MKKTILTLTIGFIIVSLTGCSDFQSPKEEKAVKQKSENSISLNKTEEFEEKEISKNNAYEKNIEIIQKEEALSFSLKIVKSYFNNDCETYFEFLEKELYIMEDNKIVNLEEIDGIKEKLCKSISKAVKGDFNYQNYLDSYNFKIMKKSEYDSEIISFEQQKNIDFSSFSSNDYLFVGYQVKEGKKSFVWDDLLLFMVKVKENKWTISGISG